MNTIERLASALADRYRIERELGQGGMATVYLAHDLKHDRKVALKVLKPELAAVLGAERFVVEIRTTAALQHPHIVPLFDSGTADGFLYYVMPFIDGEALRAKLDRETQLGVDEAVRIARDVADALDYAHRHGVIHRDIKPENILLNDGRPMVADFGIALAVSVAAGGRLTETGLSLGTPHYMSPEQATAEKELTGRSDIYSLGSVLYEMLAGDPPHTGSSAQQVIMRILTETPEAVTARRRSVPPHIAAAVAKSLEKLPADRFASAAAFATALGDPQFASATTSYRLAARAKGFSWQQWIRDPRSLVSITAVALAAVAWLRTNANSPTRHGPATLRFAVSSPADSTVVSLSVSQGLPIAEPVVSADGRHVAFGLTRSTGPSLYIRALDAFAIFEVPGGGQWPFFSPDGASIGFLRDSEIWTMNLTERVPARVGVVADVAWDISGAVWHPDGRILVSGARGLWVFPARGGEATLLVAADSSARDRFTNLGVLTDGRLLLNITSQAGRRAEVISADGATRTGILPGFESVTVVEDVAFFSQSSQPRAVRFDVRRLEPIGDPIVLGDFPSIRPGRSIAWIDQDASFSLKPVWVALDGTVTPLALEPDQYRWPRLSPDGQRMAFSLVGDNDRLHVTDVARRTDSNLDGDTEPTWSADGRYVFASKGNRPHGGLFRQVPDGSLPPDTLLSTESGDAWPTSASPDGHWLAWYGATLGVGSRDEATDPNDVFFMDLRTRANRRFRQPGNQRGARFSPDGRWVAYQSTESGREEVHVRPWPAMDANYVLSKDGGDEPSWSPDGRELYYRHGSDMMALPVAVKAGTIERTAPRRLFGGSYYRGEYGDQSYDVARDGRFLMLRPMKGGRVDVQVALNWIDEVRGALDRAK